VHAKIVISFINIKNDPMQVIGGDSKNLTPTIDIEPKK